MTQTAPLSALPHAQQRRLWLVIGLFLAELVAIATLYQFAAEIDCRASTAYLSCRFLRSLLARGLCVLSLLAVLLLLRPGLRAALARIGGGGLGGKAVLLHLAGLVLIVMPLVVFPRADLSSYIGPSFAFWAPGAVLASLGAAGLIAPFGAWREFLGGTGRVLWPVLGFGLVLPDLADLVLPLWSHPALAGATFDLVVYLLALTGNTATALPESRDLLLEGFRVNIASQCSGIEGIALVIGFSLVYMGLMRESLHLGRFALVALPVAILLSWLLNAVRIMGLVLIGAHVSPGLAANGFHSYAGWVTFTFLALGLVFLAERVSWLRRDTAPRDLTSPEAQAATLQILPFAMLMLGGLLPPLLAHPPGLGYAASLIAPVLVLWALRRPLAALIRWPDMPGLLAGLAVGVLWWLTGPAQEAADPLALALAGLSPLAYAAWLLARGFGASIVVPLAEELFFRGYALQRLRGLPYVGLPGAVILSTIAFGLLHERWLAGIAAGLVFAALALGKRGLSSAIWAHAVANFTIVLAAALAGQPALI